MKEKIVMPDGFTQLNNNEMQKVSGGGFFGWLLGVAAGVASVIAETTQAARAADKAAGVSSHFQP